ncbi:hypothetical protein [Mycoplasmopsis verecunda]|uniref:Uncharacterized protein n=1 Tax=Mycoplasmopsis verecunda TaxID=171291 RepID=A0A1T4LGE9_9BACT|nr:hypothetical protein [Mycoplasmopsis verecunda]WPB54853.1 hypothetical protein SAM46_01710 [Mycoplasmopsis verecunda]SJZ53658.1 hypothetical protein SAMN02745154_00442 [Mycoplasmopsis verecunda]
MLIIQPADTNVEAKAQPRTNGKEQKVINNKLLIENLSKSIDEMTVWDRSLLLYSYDLIDTLNHNHALQNSALYKTISNSLGNDRINPTTRSFGEKEMNQIQSIETIKNILEGVLGKVASKNMQESESNKKKAQVALSAGTATTATVSAFTCWIPIVNIIVQL